MDQAIAGDNERRELIKLLRPFLRNINRVVWLDCFLRPLLLIMGSTAAIHLLLKMLLPGYAVWAATLLVLLLPALWFAWHQCKRKGLFFQMPDLAEVVDHLYENDGSVTATYERPKLCPSPQFYQELTGVLAQRFPRYNFKRLAKQTFPVLGFSLVALLIPARHILPGSQQQEILAAITQPMAEQLEANKELLSEEQKKELMQDLEQVKEADQGVSREQWEAVEELQKRAEDAVKENQANLSQMSNSMSELSTMMNEAGSNSSPLGLEPQQQAKMDKLVQDLAVRGEAKNLPLSESQRQRLSQTLKQCKGGKGGKKCNGDLAKSLAELSKELQSKCQNGGNPGGENIGNGGRDRGRGDAPYVLGEEKSLAEAQYKDQLVENKFLAEEDMVDMGIIPVEPKVDPGKFSPGVVRQFNPTEGNQVSRTRISPSQRDVISKYFSK